MPYIADIQTTVWNGPGTVTNVAETTTVYGDGVRGRMGVGVNLVLLDRTSPLIQMYRKIINEQPYDKTNKVAVL